MPERLRTCRYRPLPTHIVLGISSYAGPRMYDARWYGSTYIVQFLHTSVWALRLPIGPASLTSDMNIVEYLVGYLGRYISIQPVSNLRYGISPRRSTSLPTRDTYLERSFVLPKVLISLMVFANNLIVPSYIELKKKNG